MALIRVGGLAGLIYLGFVLGFPDWTGEAYHVIVLSMIGGGAVGVFLLGRILDLGAGAGKFVVEALFLAAVTAFVGATMPQRSGKPPFAQWSEGVRPNREAARRGAERLGLDPDGTFAGSLIALFPKR